MATIRDIRSAHAYRLLYSGKWLITENSTQHANPLRYDYGVLSADTPPHSLNVAKKFFRATLTNDDKKDITRCLDALGLRPEHYVFSANNRWLIVDAEAFSSEIEPRMRGTGHVR